MILKILEIYSNILLPILLGALTLLILGLYLIFKKPKPKKNKFKKEIITTPAASSTVSVVEDLTAIAGDDVIITQLDLARAYIEVGRKQSAEEILKHVVLQGNAAQQKEARQLMTHLFSCASP